MRAGVAPSFDINPRALAAFVPEPSFVAARGLTSAHAQTIFATLLRSTRLAGVAYERWDLPDGDFVDVAVLAAPTDRPHVLVLHGLESSANAGYMIETLRAIQRLGWGAFAMNFRSCGTEMNRKPRSYHAGETGDALETLKRIRTQVNGPIYGIGFSLGGSVMMKLLSETGADCPIDAASVVSVPFDLSKCADLIDEGRGWLVVYRERFLIRMRKKAREKAKRFPDHFDLGEIRRARTLRRFDELVTAPLHGFASAEEYYQDSSAGPRVAQIARPTWVLSALDDPLIPASSIPIEAMKRNPFIQSLQTEHGGHVGFVAGSRLRPQYWAEAQAVNFLAHIDRIRPR
ncbi:MAG: alpha/beta fold hydrolase [Sandaracinaceae bacterium]|jgi:predicted alpha/beta-fold hydrolase|nr:alpha/beta fold hydrolase [Sandaracinaceae bacterium]